MQAAVSVTAMAQNVHLLPPATRAQPARHPASGNGAGLAAAPVPPTRQPLVTSAPLHSATAAGAPVQSRAGHAETGSAVVLQAGALTTATSCRISAASCTLPSASRMRASWRVSRARSIST